MFRSASVSVLAAMIVALAFASTITGCAPRQTPASAPRQTSATIQLVIPQIELTPEERAAFENSVEQVPAPAGSQK